ncbi:site-2 protease family protein [Kosmotoga pacifica]|uniref:Peptidase M50 n=1 Tax=Kosmotoga pacifica TaxID=1330330 RepID=A0A0G2Z6R0_9BACT|nr:site-2 protease family protein [Kosmotoga pacifica]AKI97295.1 peptidase M50 [Kosmotoga pacifica]
MIALYFIAIFTGVVVAHELGHYIFARFFGVRILEFAIGFGPKLFSIKGKETTFSIRLIPLGGYVKMAGENLETLDEHAEDIPKEQLFNTKPSWQRFLIAFSGPLFSILAGFLIFAIAGAIWGFPEVIIERVQPNSPAYYAGLQSGDRIVSINGGTVIESSTLSRKVKTGRALTLDIERNGELIEVDIQPRLLPEGAVFVLGDVEGSPGKKLVSIDGVLVDNGYSAIAQSLRQGEIVELVFEDGKKVRATMEYLSLTEPYFALGIYYASFEPEFNIDARNFKAGDRIVRINDFPVRDGLDFSYLIQSISADQSTMYLYFTGNMLEQVVTGLPEDLEIEVLRNGQLVTIRMSKSEFISILEEPNVFKRGFDYWYPGNVFEAFSLGVKWATELLRTMVVVISNLFTGQASLREFTGPVGIVKLVGDAAKAGIKMVILLVGLITLNLGVINLLPLPALDGGRMILALVEMVIRRRIDPKVEAYIQTIGFFILIGIILYITAIDVGRFLGR